MNALQSMLSFQLSNSKAGLWEEEQLPCFNEARVLSTVGDTAAAARAAECMDIFFASALFPEKEASVSRSSRSSMRLSSKRALNPPSETPFDLMPSSTPPCADFASSAAALAAASAASASSCRKDT